MNCYSCWLSRCMICEKIWTVVLANSNYVNVEGFVRYLGPRYTPFFQRPRTRLPCQSDWQVCSCAWVVLLEGQECPRSHSWGVPSYLLMREDTLIGYESLARQEIRPVPVVVVSPYQFWTRARVTRLRCFLTNLRDRISVANRACPRNLGFKSLRLGICSRLLLWRYVVDKPT